MWAQTCQECLRLHSQSWLFLFNYPNSSARQVTPSHRKVKKKADFCVEGITLVVDLVHGTTGVGGSLMEGCLLAHHVHSASIACLHCFIIIVPLGQMWDGGRLMLHWIHKVYWKFIFKPTLYKRAENKYHASWEIFAKYLENLLLSIVQSQKGVI